MRGDFPWAMPRWVELDGSISFASLSATGQRALVEARGEIFTVPTEHGSVRNMTGGADAADRTPVWSPDGGRVAWFSDNGNGYRLMIADQDGLGEPRSISIGDSKLVYDPNTHGADWAAVRERYEPLVAHVRHRDDLNYILDEVWMDARAAAEGRDPQLERGVDEALRLLEVEGVPTVTLPPYSTPARRRGQAADGSSGR